MCFSNRGNSSTQGDPKVNKRIYGAMRTGNEVWSMPPPLKEQEPANSPEAVLWVNADWYFTVGVWAKLHSAGYPDVAH